MSFGSTGVSVSIRGDDQEAIASSHASMLAGILSGRIRGRRTTPLMISGVLTYSGRDVAAPHGLTVGPGGMSSTSAFSITGSIATTGEGFSSFILTIMSAVFKAAVLRSVWSFEYTSASK